MDCTISEAEIDARAAQAAEQAVACWLRAG
jgi:hypothetical protein